MFSLIKKGFVHMITNKSNLEHRIQKLTLDLADLKFQLGTCGDNPEVKREINQEIIGKTQDKLDAENQLRLCR